MKAIVHADERQVGVNVYHRHWVKCLEASMREDRGNRQKQAASAAAKRHSISQFSHKLRKAILSGEEVAGFWKHSSGSTARPVPTADNEQLNNAAEVEKGTAVLNCRTGPTYTPQEEVACCHAAPQKQHGQQTKLQHSAAAIPTPPSTSHADPALPTAATPTTPRPASTAAAQPVPPPLPATAAAATTTDGAVSIHKPVAEAMGHAREAAGSGLAQTGLPVACSAAGNHGKPGKPHLEHSSMQVTKRKAARPAWALSPDEAAELEEGEEAELLKFAEDLDFDMFVAQLDDIELQDTFKELQEAETSQQTGGDIAWKKTFIRAMNHVTSKSILPAVMQRMEDGASVSGRTDVAHSVASKSSCRRSEAAASQLAARLREQQDWDASTKADDAPDKSLTPSKVREAEECLYENPDMRAVHSVASIKCLLAKTQQMANLATI